MPGRTPCTSSTGAFSSRGFDLMRARQSTSPRISSATCSAVALPLRGLAEAAPPPKLDEPPGAEPDPLEPHAARPAQSMRTTNHLWVCMASTFASGRLFGIGDALDVFVQLEEHDDELAPDACSDLAADRDGDAAHERAEGHVLEAHVEHGPEARDDRGDEQQPIHHRHDFGCPHGIEEENVSNCHRRIPLWC